VSFPSTQDCSLRILLQAFDRLRVEVMLADLDLEDLPDKQAVLPELLRALMRAMNVHSHQSLIFVFMCGEHGGVDSMLRMMYYLHPC
jgi:hypothetical protein